MRILFLCNKAYWEHKMSRVRFHAMDALSRIPGVTLIKDGQGFSGFESVRISVNKNNPDAVIWYKPMKISGVEYLRESRIPKIICYNEMHDRKETCNEIRYSGSNIVVCHLGNYIDEYRKIFPKVSFYLVPHCAEKTIFKNLNIKKAYDVLLTGTVGGKAYPFRKRLANIIINRLGKYNCKILKHPGYRIENVNAQVKEYVKEINKAKVVLASSSIYNYALAKYIEIGMCGTCLCADIPFDRPEWYRKWVVEINPNEVASSITDKVRRLLDSGKWKDHGLNALHYCKSEVQEKYAMRIIEIIKARGEYAV